MKKRFLYPGEINPGDCIIITGSINTMFIAEAANALANGIRSRGYSCNILMPGMARSYVCCDQSGDAMGFDYSKDVSLVVMGEYLGKTHFRQGDLTQKNFTRCVFFSDVANPSVSFSFRPDWEKERIESVCEIVSTAIGIETHAAPTSLLRPSGSERALLETTNEVIYCLENNIELPEALKKLRVLLYDEAGMDQVPALERKLW